jgi:hypothetical protein
MGENFVKAAALRWNDEAQWPAALNLGHRFAVSSTEPVRLERPQISTPSTTSEASWVEPTSERLNELMFLGPNWDQRGSAAVNIDALRFAWQFLCQTMPPNAPAPGIIPLGHGGVQLLWHGPQFDIEIEVIGPNNIVVYYFEKISGQEDEFPLTNEFSIVTPLFSKVFGAAS